MRWLKEHGLTSSHEDYLRLPLGVLEDARLLMEYDFNQAEMAARLG